MWVRFLQGAHGTLSSGVEQLLYTEWAGGSNPSACTMKKSAGILLYRRKKSEPEFFLIHPGGPFFAGRDNVWGLPKGEYKENENAFEAAKREFKEETSFNLPEREFIELTPVTDRNGKEISAWAVEHDVDPSKLQSNTFKLWGKEFPEVDRGEWFDLKEARKKASHIQVKLVEELASRLKSA
jgi:predicted NUDIX family NTP pyrophosphohydrolase